MISVAMATYNGEKYIRKQLESILNQTKMVDEIIICDDCSSDNTCVIINEIIRTHLEGNRIRLICNERNLGYYRNRACIYFCRDYGSFIASWNMPSNRCIVLLFVRLFYNGNSHDYVSYCGFYDMRGYHKITINKD